MNVPKDTYSKIIGYVLWVFGFMGAHRFYFGRPVSGTIYFFTLGIFLIGWIVDLFLITAMELYHLAGACSRTFTNFIHAGLRAWVPVYKTILAET